MARTSAIARTRQCEPLPKRSRTGDVFFPSARNVAVPTPTAAVRRAADDTSDSEGEESGDESQSESGSLSDDTSDSSQESEPGRSPSNLPSFAEDYPREEEDEVEEDEVQPAEAGVNGNSGPMGNGLTLADPDVLDCPICLDPLSIPVYQCENGHFSCRSCCRKIKDRCPSCSTRIGYKRCSGMEKVLESIKTSCQNMKHGCMEKISYCKKLDHEKSCKYTPTPCPSPGCKYIGGRESFYNHYVKKHPGSCKLITFNDVNWINVGEEPYLLVEKEEKILFFLNRVLDPLGSFVNVSTASNMKFSYDLTAGSGEKSVNMKTLVEITPKCFAKPAKEKCLLITRDILSGADYMDIMLRLQLVIRKAS